MEKISTFNPGELHINTLILNKLKQNKYNNQNMLTKDVQTGKQIVIDT